MDEILSWATRFDDASYEAKHLVIAQLVDRIEIRKNDGYDTATDVMVLMDNCFFISCPSF